MIEGYEGVEPYIYDLQSKWIALCNISLFFMEEGEGGLINILNLLPTAPPWVRRL